MIYYEYRALGTWHPATTDERPQARGKRLLTAGHVGPLIRNVTELPPALEGLPLDTLRQLVPDIGKEGVSFSEGGSHD